MKAIAYIIIGFLVFACSSKEGGYGKLIVSKYKPVYEDDNIYYPHDYFFEVEMQMINTALSVEKASNCIKITNVFNAGLSGYTVGFTISKNLDITSVEYDRWTDIINGSETKYTVEKVIFSTNTNPFENDQIVGYYTLQIREEFSAGELLEEHGTNDTVTYFLFNGKFKVYSELEKEKGRDWVIDQNEILHGIKDSLDVYYLPDKYAIFLGDHSILKQLEIDQLHTKSENMSYVILEMVIDEKGNVIPESMIIKDMKSNELVRKLRNCELLLSNWQPAIHKGRPVKSIMELPILIKD